MCAGKTTLAGIVQIRLLDISVSQHTQHFPDAVLNGAAGCQPEFFRKRTLAAEVDANDFSAVTGLDQILVGRLQLIN